MGHYMTYKSKNLHSAIFIILQKKKIKPSSAISKAQSEVKESGED
jgi:hypothetical protein